MSFYFLLALFVVHDKISFFFPFVSLSFPQKINFTALYLFFQLINMYLPSLLCKNIVWEVFLLPRNLTSLFICILKLFCLIYGIQYCAGFYHILRLPKYSHQSFHQWFRQSHDCRFFLPMVPDK